MPCAVLAEADESVVHGLVLRRPFKMEQIVAVLNTAGTASADSGAVEAFAEDFYVRELDDFSTPAAGPDEDIWGRRESTHPLPRLSAEEHRAGLDYHIKGDPLIEPEAPRPLIQTGTTFARGNTEPSRRAEARAEQNRHRLPPGVVGEPVDVEPIVIPRNDSLSAGGNANAGPRLIDWLDGDLLRSPTQMQLPECPALTLDPKQRVFHADADLADLIAYCIEPLPPQLATSTSTTDLARVREDQPARPYDDLRWLDALLRSTGRLATRLDPGGSYRLRQPVKVNPDFQTHGAIVAALSQPIRLHEVAAQTGASMERVFDVVNAYDAIDRLAWTPRQRRGESESSPEKSGGAGVLARLKWPFGKR